MKRFFLVALLLVSTQLLTGCHALTNPVGVAGALIRNPVSSALNLARMPLQTAGSLRGMTRYMY